MLFKTSTTSKLYFKAHYTAASEAIPTHPQKEEYSSQFLTTD
jgi:hypothetical protein